MRQHIDLFMTVKTKKMGFLIAMFLLIITSSCKKDFLETPDKTVLLYQGYVKDLRTSEQFVNGLYIGLAANFLTGLMVIYPDIIADNLKPTRADFSIHYSWSQMADLSDAGTITAGESNANGAWHSGYKIIRSCNLMIETIDQYRSENPVKADDLKGQVYAIRALVHFYLVNVFSQPYVFSNNGSHPGIPYITSSRWADPVSRQTVGEIYAALENDLNTAISLLSSKVTDTRIMNILAAKALLARVYLFKGNYGKAKELSLDVCNQVPLMTIADGYPQQVYNLLPPSQTESLFQFHPASEGVSSGAGNYLTRFSGFYFDAPRLRFLATNDIAGLLKENADDIRAQWIRQEPNGNIISKFPKDVLPDFPTPTMSYFQTLLRSSEMFLTVAEASAKTGDENMARTYINNLRERSDLAISPVAATGQALLDTIYKERRKELCFEGLRMFDLLRQGKGVVRIDAPPGAETLPFPSNKAIAPIPLSDVNLANLTQNNGY